MTTALEWRAFRSDVENLADTVAREIRSYPPPIQACDAQFNHLLELRRMLPLELARLDRAAEDGSITIDEFVDSSPCGETLSKIISQTDRRA